MKTCGREGNYDIYWQRRRGTAGLRPLRRFPELYQNANRESKEREKKEKREKREKKEKREQKSGGGTIIRQVKETPLLIMQNQEVKDSSSVIGGGRMRREPQERGSQC